MAEFAEARGKSFSCLAAPETILFMDTSCLCLQLLLLLAGILSSDSFPSCHVYVIEIPTQETFLEDPLYIGPSPCTFPLPYFVLHNITGCIYLVDLCTFKEPVSPIKMFHKDRYLFCVVCFFKLKSNQGGQEHYINIYEETNEC